MNANAMTYDAAHRLAKAAEAWTAVPDCWITSPEGLEVYEGTGIARPLEGLPVVALRGVAGRTLYPAARFALFDTIRFETVRPNPNGVLTILAKARWLGFDLPPFGFSFHAPHISVPATVAELTDTHRIICETIRTTGACPPLTLSGSVVMQAQEAWLKAVFVKGIGG